MRVICKRCVMRVIVLKRHGRMVDGVINRNLALSSLASEK